MFAYGAPGVGAGYMFLLLSLYVMKFSTDVLLIAPAVMGVIFSISRVWDAFADPVVGYLSDRTKHPMGRRRIWMLASVIPICATFVMLFSPPATMGTFGLVDVDGRRRHRFLFGDHAVCGAASVARRGADDELSRAQPFVRPATRRVHAWFDSRAREHADLHQCRSERS